MVVPRISVGRQTFSTDARINVGFRRAANSHQQKVDTLCVRLGSHVVNERAEVTQVCAVVLLIGVLFMSKKV